jgi:acetyl-CoA acetyltransferase
MGKNEAAVAVVGVGDSRYSWESGQSEHEMAATAIRNALVDAGIEPTEVDGVVRFNIESTTPAALVERFGFQPLRLTGDATSGGSSAVTMLALARGAIISGQAEVVVGFRSFNGRSGRRLGQNLASQYDDAGHQLASGMIPLGGEFSGPYGVISPGCLFSLWLDAYRQKFGLKSSVIEDAMAAVVLRQRACACNNSNALLRDRPLDRAGYDESRRLFGLLRAADLCLESDGACAFVVAGAGAIARAFGRPVYVLATDQATGADYDQLFTESDDLPPRPARPLLEPMLDRFGLSHDEIAVAGTYDAASVHVLFDMESLGYCKPGEACDWLAQTKLAINPSGGMLAEVYLQGTNALVEIVRQLKGQATSQVAGAQFGTVSGAAAQSVALLSTEFLQ